MKLWSASQKSLGTNGLETHLGLMMKMKQRFIFFAAAWIVDEGRKFDSVFFFDVSTLPKVWNRFADSILTNQYELECFIFDLLNIVCIAEYDINFH